VNCRYRREKSRETLEDAHILFGRRFFSAVNRIYYAYFIDSMADGNIRSYFKHSPRRNGRCPRRIEGKVARPDSKDSPAVISEDENSAELLELYERENFVP